VPAHWENQHVDNIQLTTIGAALALVGGATGFADGFSTLITDSGNSAVDTTKPITVKLDSTTLAPASYTVSKTGPVTTIVYHGFPTLLAVGSKHTVSVSATDGNNNTVSGTPTFVVPVYATLPVGDEVTGVDQSKVGFRMMPWQSGNEPNRIYWANEQVFGLHGANNANLAGATDGGYIDYNGVLNFNINAGSGDAGQFTTNNGWADMKFPGIPGANTLNGSTAEEILTFMKFSAPGVYQMGVDSDDGFAVTEGINPRDRFSLLLGQFDGGRGQGSPTYFTIAVTNAGIYPLRLLWENGNGELPGNGAGLEWFTVQTNGTKILINDPGATNNSGVSVYYAGPGAPAFTSQINPYPGQTGVRPDQVIAQLTDGASTVNANSIKLTVSGPGVTSPAPTISKTGAVTTVKLAFSPLLTGGSNYTATLVWSDSATPANNHSNTWSFSVMNYSVVLDPSLSVPAGSVDKTQYGLRLQLSQADPTIVGAASTVTRSGFLPPGLIRCACSTSKAAVAPVWNGPSLIPGLSPMVFVA
jgi:hypothetical protein